MRYAINIGLTLIILVLAYLLYQTIAEPIRFQKAKKERYSAVIERLKRIKEVQFAYKDLKGGFADNFDSLLYTVKYDTFEIVKIFGNPDDTTQEVTRDTMHVPVKDSLFHDVQVIDSLPVIPYSRNQQFDIDAGHITKGKVKVPVFQVKAYDTTFLYDQPQQFVEKDHYLGIGSMSEATYAGNWE